MANYGKIFKLEDLVINEWETIKRAETGTLFDSFIIKEFPCVIMKGPMSLTAYVGIKTYHPCAKFENAEKLEEKYVHIPCHGGVTFFKAHEDVKKKSFPETFKNLKIIGWDYSHSGDEVIWPEEAGYFNYETFGPKPKRWTIKEVKKDCKKVCHFLYNIEVESRPAKQICRIQDVIEI